MKTSGQSLDQFRSYLYLLARAHIGPSVQQRVDASDLVQQTLLDAHAKKDQFRGDTDAQRAAWLRQILAHNLKDALRHHHRAKRDISRQQPLEAGIDESFRRAQVWLVAQQSSPSQQAEEKEELLRLADTLTQLSDDQRDAVILRHLQGMSLAEVASQLDRSEEAAAGLVYRGLKRLHDLLEQQEDS